MFLLGRKKKPPIRQPQLMEGQDGYVFRRSRTITGTVSPRVAVTAPQQGQLKTGRLKLHELMSHRRQLLRLLAGVSTVVGVLTLLLLNFIFTPVIQYPQAEGAHKPPTESYVKSLYAYFADRPLERFGLWLNAEDLNVFMRRHHTEIQSVGVARAWYGGEAIFSVIFRTPLLSWQTGSRTFYVDKEGTAFTYNHFAKPVVQVVDQSGIPPDAQGTVASSRFIRFLGRMVGAVNGYGKGDVTSVIIPASTREIDLKLKDRPYNIRTQIDRDPLQQAEDIANALTYFDTKNIKPEYIDVRVARKAFYK